VNLLHRLGLPFWSILIAIVLWVQVHGQGIGSIRMDVALQVRDVPADMVIVNDLPDQVSITISGLQTQLNALDAKDLFVSVDASSLRLPGVIEQPLDIETIDLPVGLKVEKIQPDSVQLQVDHIVKRTLDVMPVFDLPQGWRAEYVVVTPANIELTGPEVWLSALDKVETTAIRLDLKPGLFDVKTTVAPLSGQGIHVLKKDLSIRVRGELFWTPLEQATITDNLQSETVPLDAESGTQEPVSIVPVPEEVKVQMEAGAHQQLQEQVQGEQEAEDIQSAVEANNMLDIYGQAEPKNTPELVEPYGQAHMKLIDKHNPALEPGPKAEDKAMKGSE